MIFHIILFLVSCLLLSWLSARFIRVMTDVARYLKWREFIVAFFVMGIAASLPNLLVDLNASLRGLQIIAFGDIMGGNLIDLTLAMGIIVMFSRKHISTKSEMVQGSAIFTAMVAILPWLLIFRTGGLDRLDGLILIGVFLVYVWWLFSKDKRFKKSYRRKNIEPAQENSSLTVKIAKLILMLAVLIGSSFAIVYSAQYFSATLNISLGLVGLLIVALGNCFPEIYFGVLAARKEENWLVLGDMMASVIVTSTLVLGIVALVAPFQIVDFSPYLIARIFMIIACVLYFIFISSNQKFTKGEGLILLLLYLLFLVIEIFWPIR